MFFNKLALATIATTAPSTLLPHGVPLPPLPHVSSLPLLPRGALSMQWCSWRHQHKDLPKCHWQNEHPWRFRHGEHTLAIVTMGRTLTTIATGRNLAEHHQSCHSVAPLKLSSWGEPSPRGAPLTMESSWQQSALDSGLPWMTECTWQWSALNNGASSMMEHFQWRSTLNSRAFLTHLVWLEAFWQIKHSIKCGFDDCNLFWVDLVWSQFSFAISCN